MRDDAALRTAAAHPTTGPNDWLSAALDRIEPKLREALLLKYGEGLGYDEMAKLTGVGKSALKMRVKRASEAIRALLPEGIDA